MNTDEFYMAKALSLAQKAYDENEIPVGAVVVDKDGNIAGEGYDRREGGKNALLHAELIAINEACEKLHGWRLYNCTLYVTLEPCPMCAGAAVNAHIKRIVYGAANEKNGAAGSAVNICAMPGNFRPEVFPGVMEEQCADLIHKFFIKLRSEENKNGRMQS